MNTFPSEWLNQVYAWSLLLFPGRFRDEYGEEMKSVFAEAFHNAAAVSRRSVGLMILREVRDLPGNLLHAYWSEFRRGKMQTFSEPSGSSLRSSLHGALVFGSSSMILFLVICLLDVFLNNGKPIFDRSSVWGWRYLIYFTPQALTSGFAMAWLNKATGKRRAWIAGMVATLGMIIFARLLLPICDTILNSPSADNQSIYILIIQVFYMSLVGLIVGGATVWLQRQKANWAWYGLAGTLGSCLGYLLMMALGAIIQIRIETIGLEKFTIGGLGYFVYRLETMVVYGLVFGALLGLAMGKRYIKETLPIVA
jgi:hypothetical protein